MEKESSYLFYNIPEICFTSIGIIFAMLLMFSLESIIKTSGSIFGSLFSKIINKNAKAWRWNNALLFVQETYMPVLLFSCINLMESGF